MGSFSHTFDISPSQIMVNRDERQRRQIDSEDLEGSIKARGQINPIVVEVAPAGASLPYLLVAGERRLSACQALGIDVIARLASDLSSLEHQLIELEENIKRQDLAWQDITKAIGRIHNINRTANADWTIGKTADSIGLSISVVSMYLRVEAELESNTRVAEAGTAREAYNIVVKREARANASALDELIAPVPPPRVKTMIEGAPSSILLDVPAAAPSPLPPPVPIPVGPPPVEQTILHASFLDWAPSYSGPKFNFIHCDFPYGINFASGPQGLGSETAVYDDTEEIYWKLLSALLDNAPRLLTLSAHIMFWYSEKHGQRTRELFTAAGFKVLRHPLIWVKSDNSGISPDAKRLPRHVYETALVVSRSDRQLVRVKADAYSAPSDRRLHPSTKPEPMLKHFLEMFVDEYTEALDPTCGSGSAIRACEHFDAKRVVGLEMDEQYLRPARAALHSSRLLRGASSRFNSL